MFGLGMIPFLEGPVHIVIALVFDFLILTMFVWMLASWFLAMMPQAGGGRFMRLLETIVSPVFDPVKKRIAGDIMASFHAWLIGRLPDDEADPPRAAWALLALIEGIVVLNAAGHGEAALGAAGLLLGETPQP